MTIGDVPLWFLRAFAVAFGLIWGSFLNVVIYRVPREMSVVRPASHCPGCGKPVEPYDNIPVLSYLILRGKTRCCRAPLSPRYPLVEVLGGALSLAVVEVVVRAMPYETSFERAGAVYLADLFLTLGLLAAAFIDAEHMFLPDTITIGGAVLGVATATLRGRTFSESLLGAAIGFGGIWFPFVFGWKHLRGRAGMGMGDAKLTMLAGAWFGWIGVLFVLMGGAVQGTLYAGAVYLVRGKIEEPAAVKADREELERLAAEGDDEAKQLLLDDPLGTPQGEGFGQARLPFGPFLILAVLEYLFAGPQILEKYREWFLGAGG